MTNMKKISKTVGKKNLVGKAIANKVLIFAVTLLALIALLLLRNIFGKGKTETLKNKIVPDAVSKMVGGNTKIAINNFKETSGVYEFELALGEGTSVRKFTSYITKDGKIIFTSGIKLNSLAVQGAQTQTQQKKLTCNDLKKEDASKLTAFVVSNCPYGLQMQRVFKKALEEQPALASNLEVRYLGSIEGDKIISMHGDKEAQENLKQICIREEQKEKYWPYVSCYMQEGKSEDCSVTAGVDTVSLETCLTDKTKGITYAKKDFDLASKFQVSSSPTLLLNDTQIVSEFDFGGRIANAIKQVVCCGSKTQGEYCKTDLLKDEVATAFSLTDAPAAGAGGSAANCATQ